MTACEQLDRTIGLVIDHFDEYDHLMMGMILRPRRLFNRGDFVVFYFDNGQAERWKSTFVSSKGYSIKDFYVHFQAWFPSHRKRTRSKKNYKVQVNESGRIFRDATFIEKPGESTGGGSNCVPFMDVFSRWLPNPAVQQEIVESLRARTAAPR